MKTKNSEFSLSEEQKEFIEIALKGSNILVDACIGSGKTTSIQYLCDLLPQDKKILYLTYNKLLKLDAKRKIKNKNVLVTNYHGLAWSLLKKNGLSAGISDIIQMVIHKVENIPKFDILIIDEYQDIEQELADFLTMIKKANPDMQIIAVGDMEQKKAIRRVFSISAQHYAFVVNAFVALVKEYGENKYEFTLRESKTHDIIEDVRTSRSELGVLFLSKFNREVLLRIIHNADLIFVPLFTATPHVFVSRNNPLAKKAFVTLDDLKAFPRLTYEQGINNSFYYSEELHSTEESPKSIIVTDRATLFNLLIGLDGYTISSGILSSDLNGTDIVSIPLESKECMEIGYIAPTDRPLSAVSESYLEHLKNYISSYQS